MAGKHVAPVITAKTTSREIAAWAEQQRSAPVTATGLGKWLTGLTPADAKYLRKAGN